MPLNEVRYRLFKRGAPTPPAWNDDLALDAPSNDEITGAQTWQVFRLHAYERLSELYSCELVLVRHEPLPPQNVLGPGGPTVFDQLQNKVTDLRNRSNAIDQAAQNFQNANNNAQRQNAAQQYAQAWQNFGRGVNQDVPGAVNDVGRALGGLGSDRDNDGITDFEEDQMGLADMVDPLSNSGRPIDPRDFVGQTYSVALTRRDGDVTTAGRWFTGIVSEFEDLGHIGDFRVVRVLLVPRMFRLSLRKDCKIFHDKTVVEVVTEVLKKGELYAEAELVWQDPGGTTGGWNQKREYWVQYNETDLDFVSRTLAAEGITYSFQHREGVERVVFVDAAAAVPPRLAAATNGRPGTLPLSAHYETSGGTASDHELGWGFTLRKSLRSESAALWEFNHSDFGTPRAVLKSVAEMAGNGLPATPGLPSAGSGSGLPATPGLPGGAGSNPRAVREVYQYPAHFALDATTSPGRYAEYASPRPLARFRREALRADETQGRGCSNATGLAAGMTLGLERIGSDHTRYPDDAHVEGDFLVTAVRHVSFPDLGVRGPRWSVAALPPALALPRDVPTGHNELHYVNAFECVDSRTPVRPLPRAAFPAIHGLQTATVVNTPSADPHNPTDWIDVDRNARVEIRFHWDRDDVLADETEAFRTARCWARVAQAWAGDGFGAIFVPRVGMEVVVSFVDGDPAQPLVVGCVYNEVNTAPTYHRAFGEAHPDGEHNVIRTRTHVGPESDKREHRAEGYNELSFDDTEDAERIRVHAERDLNVEVLHRHETTVKRDQTIKVTKDQTELVHGEQTITVDQNREKTVVGNEQTEITGKRAETVRGDEKILVRGNRTERVHKTETITIGSTPPDHRTLTVEGERRTVVTQNDSLTVGAAKTDTIVGQYKMAAGSLAMTATGATPGAPGSEMHVDDDGTLRIDAKGNPGTITAHATSGQPAVRVWGKNTVVLESLASACEKGVRFECGRTSMQFGPDGIAIEAPGAVVLGCAGSAVVLEEHKLVLHAGPSDSAAPAHNVFLMNMTAWQTEYARPDVSFDEVGFVRQGTEDAEKIPGVYLSTEHFAVQAATGVLVKSKKGINLQEDAAHDPKRLRSPQEDHLLENAKTAREDADAAWKRVEEREKEWGEASANYKIKQAEVGAMRKEFEKAGGPMSEMLKARAVVATRTEELEAEKAKVARKQKALEEAQAKNAVDMEHLDLQDAEGDRNDAQKRLDQANADLDEKLKSCRAEFDELKKQEDELKDLKTKFEAADTALKDATREAEALEKKARQAEDDARRRTAGRWNG
jgi:type VI secretion system secreted protein VgrG